MVKQPKISNSCKPLPSLGWKHQGDRLFSESSKSCKIKRKVTWQKLAPENRKTKVLTNYSSSGRESGEINMLISHFLFLFILWLTGGTLHLLYFNKSQSEEILDIYSKSAEWGRGERLDLMGKMTNHHRCSSLPYSQNLLFFKK